MKEGDEFFYKMERERGEEVERQEYKVDGWG